MSKKRRTNKKVKQKKPFNWKKNSKWLAIASLLIILSGYFYNLSEINSRVEHDLSVIGNGKPTVVQIHDPGCQLCRQLKVNLDSTKSDFEEKIQYKTANIKTKKGAEFAKKHDVPHVTLLFFNRSGRLIETLRGVNTKETIMSALRTLK